MPTQVITSILTPHENKKDVQEPHIETKKRTLPAHGVSPRVYLCLFTGQHIPSDALMVDTQR
jgi:hypothetical protein